MDEQALMEIALLAAKKSYGKRGKVGIVAVKLNENNEIIQQASACNGLPKNLHRTKCETDAPTVEESHTLPEVLHAEENLICNLCSNDQDLKEAICFITRTPCKHCAAHLVACGIKKLFYFSEHPHGDGLPILEEAGVQVQQLSFKQNILEDKYL